MSAACAGRAADCAILVRADDNVVIRREDLRLWEGRPMTDRRVRWTTLALAILAGMLATPAQGASPSFSSSFEPSDPQPTWTDTAERAQGVTGPERPGIPGNVTGHRRRDAGERRERAPARARRTSSTAPRTPSGWPSRRPAGSSCELAEPVTIVRYALTSANDAAGRDPRDWTLQGSDDGSDVDDARHAAPARTSPTASRRRRTTSPTRTAYALLPARHHRATTAAAIIQLAELQLSNGRAQPAAGARHAHASSAAARAAATTPRPAPASPACAALRYAGRHVAEGRAYSYNKVFDVDVRGHGRRPSCPT